jgi:hypothetical protein
MPTFRYSVIQYVPSPVRDERINVGVIVVGADPEFFGSRLLAPSQRGRLKRLGFAQSFSFLDDLGRELVESAVTEGELPLPTSRPWSATVLEAAHMAWANTVQLTAPRAAIHERPKVLLDSLYAELVADPAERRHRARDRRWIRRRALTGLRAGLQGAPGFDFDAHVRKDIRVTGDLEQHRFDIQLLNGQPLRLIQGLALEGVGARDREIEALAWTIDDVQKHATTPISILSVGEGSDVDRAQHIYEGLGAQVVREPEFDDWFDATATGLLVAVGN